MPVSVTDAVTAPLVGDSEVSVAVGTTVNATPLLATPPTVTTTLPVVVPLGTGATMLVADMPNAGNKRAIKAPPDAETAALRRVEGMGIGN